MGFPSHHLHPNEQIVVDLHPHWWFMTPRALALAAAMALGVVVQFAWGPTGNLGTVAGIAVGLLILVALNAKFFEWMGAYAIFVPWALVATFLLGRMGTRRGDVTLTGSTYDEPEHGLLQAAAPSPAALRQRQRVAGR